MARLTLKVRGETGFNTEEALAGFYEEEVEPRIRNLLLNGTTIISWKILPLHGPFDPSPKIAVEIEGPHIDAFLPAIATVLRREIKALREAEIA